MKYLAKFYDWCRDDFPVEGVMILSENEYEEFLQYWEALSKLLDEGYEFEWYFGTNEYIYYCNSFKWKEAFTFESILDKEAKVLKGTIFTADNYIGLMPNAEFMYDELKDYFYDVEEREEYEDGYEDD